MRGFEHHGEAVQLNETQRREVGGGCGDGVAMVTLVVKPDGPPRWCSGVECADVVELLS